MTKGGMNAAEWGLLLLLSVLWGGSFLFVGIAVKAVPAFTIVFSRLLIASLVLLIILRLWRIPVPWRSDLLWACCGMGLLNNVLPFSLIAWAQGGIPSGLASILNATTPIFTVLVLHVFAAGERAGPLKFAGVLVGFIGVAVMIGTDALGGTDLPILPQLAMLAAAVCYAFSGLWGRRFARIGAPPLVVAAGQLSVSCLLMAPLMLLVDRPWASPFPGIAPALAILALGLFSTALAYVIFFRILATAGAMNLALVTFLIPVSAILLGVIFLGESLGTRHLMGMMAIGCGLALIDGRLPRSLASLGRRDAS